MFSQTCYHHIDDSNKWRMSCFQVYACLLNIDSCCRCLEFAEEFANILEMKKTKKKIWVPDPKANQKFNITAELLHFYIPTSPSHKTSQIQWELITFLHRLLPLAPKRRKTQRQKVNTILAAIETNFLCC